MIRCATSRARDWEFLRKIKVTIALALTLLLPFHGLLAQTHVTDVQVAGSPKLFITILEGEGALNNIRARTAREPIVQVEDENHKPLADVSVVFLLKPGETGANGVFGPRSVYQTVTDANGRAIGRDLKPNDKSGEFMILVIAALAGSTAEILIHQTNTPDGEPLPNPTPGARFPLLGSGGGGSASGRPLGSTNGVIAETGTSGIIATWLAGIGGAAGTSLGIVELLNSNGKSASGKGGVSGGPIGLSGSGSGGLGGTPPPVHVPEIDPSEGMTCLALLAGVLALLRNR